MNAKRKSKKYWKRWRMAQFPLRRWRKPDCTAAFLQEFIKNSEMYRFGLAWEDDFYPLQRKYRRGIYSHDTTLHLLGCSDRTLAKYTMTFLKGYNAPSLKEENLIIKRAVPKSEFGQTQIESPSGNLIRVYDLKRTLCDILHSSDVQSIGEAMKRYAAWRT